MSTRAHIVVKGQECGKIGIYHHSDGYPSGLGSWLAEFLDGFQVVNGLNTQRGKVANGMGCLAAQIVKHFKDRPGGVYLQENDGGPDYRYVITASGDGPQPRTPSAPHKPADQVRMRCFYAGGPADEKLEFDGTPAEFLAWVNKKEGGAL